MPKICGSRICVLIKFLEGNCQVKCVIRLGRKFLQEHVQNPVARHRRESSGAVNALSKQNTLCSQSRINSVLWSINYGYAKIHIGAYAQSPYQYSCTLQPQNEPQITGVIFELAFELKICTGQSPVKIMILQTPSILVE